MLKQMREYGQALFSRTPEGSKARRQLASKAVVGGACIVGLFNMAGCAVVHEDGPVYRGRPVPSNTYWREETIYVRPPVQQYYRYETYDDYGRRDHYDRRDGRRERYEHRGRHRDDDQYRPYGGGGRWPAGSDGKRTKSKGSGSFKMKLKID